MSKLDDKHLNEIAAGGDNIKDVAPDDSTPPEHKYDDGGGGGGGSGGGGGGGTPIGDDAPNEDIGPQG